MNAVATQIFEEEQHDFNAYNFYELQKEIIDEEDPNLTVVGFKSLTINYMKFIRTLKYLGFRRVDINNQTFLVHIKDNVIEEVNQQKIIDAFMTHMENIPQEHRHYKVREKIQSTCIARLATLFSDYVLHRMLDDRECEFLKDTKDHCYFFYQNGVVKVGKSNIEFLKYKDIPQYIFKNKILKRDFKILKPEEYNSSTWSQFVNNIGDNYQVNGNSKNPKRAEDLKRIIGYLLHGYFEGKLKAIVFTDARISDEADGRTGKTLLCKGMGHILNETQYAKTYVEVNGKDFDPMDRFKWQELGIDTKLVHLNDVKKYFQFDVLFNDISEGIKRQRKNEGTFHLWSKIIISTNRTIKIHGSSAEDRSLEFEMADYYSSKFSPQDEFKQWFFRDWDENAWNQFDNFMISCVQQYLQHGLTQPESINLNVRKLREETQPEFVDFMITQKISHMALYNKKDLYDNFMNHYTDFKKLTNRKFNTYIKRYAQFKDEIKNYHERKSNGIYYFQFEYEESYLEQLEEEENEA